MSKTRIKELEDRIEKLESIVLRTGSRPISEDLEPIKRSFTYYLAFKGESAEDNRSIFTAEVYFASLTDDLADLNDLGVIQENEVNEKILEEIDGTSYDVNIDDYELHLSDNESIFKIVDFKVSVIMSEFDFQINVREDSPRLIKEREGKI